MDITGWDNYYKLDVNGNQMSTSNLLYTPKINLDKTIMCMSWDSEDPYQTMVGFERPYYTADLVTAFFRREIEYLNFFKDYSWAPTIIDINEKKQQIFFKFPGNTCNNIIYGKKQKLEDYAIDWKEQITEVLKNIIDAGYYKMSLYPHCFFFDNGKLKTFDFYACIERSNPYLSEETIRGFRGKESGFRFVEALSGGVIDFSIFFKQSLKEHIKWPDDVLLNFYNEQFNKDQQGV
jgi:hypothetical protein